MRLKDFPSAKLSKFNVTSSTAHSSYPIMCAADSLRTHRR